MESSPFQPYADQLIAWASAEERKEELLAAKAEYFKLTGEVFEDDKSFEQRMASFLDFYTLDRPAGGTGKTPAQHYLEQRQAAGAAEEELGALRSFTETLHGLFEVRKLGKGVLKLRELDSGKDYEVTERRQLAGLEKGDLLEARLIPYGGHLLFSAAFCYHPKAVAKVIVKEVKRRKKKEPDRSPKDVIWDCSKMALKTERYRQIAVEKIYDFEQKKL
jgi:hypothetical protein